MQADCLGANYDQACHRPGASYTDRRAVGVMAVALWLLQPFTCIQAPAVKVKDGRRPWDDLCSQKRTQCFSLIAWLLQPPDAYGACTSYQSLSGTCVLSRTDTW